MDLMVAGLHFIAFPLMAARCSQREAQATVIQDVMIGHTGESIILGDLNDYDNSILDTAGDVPISKVSKRIAKKKGNTTKRKRNKKET